ncbi:MAG: response regulator transcription factor [Spirochaetales bacterium]|nr:response regulator transcription factor [Spirochaetales bacterium]
MIEIVIVDDQDLVRESLEFIMNANEDIRVVGTAASGAEGLTLIYEKSPRVVLMDIRMPGLDGIECIRRIKEARPEIAVIALTTFDDDEYIYDALKYGARGYLLKSIKAEELARAVRTVAEGGSLITPRITTKVLDFFSTMAKADFIQGSSRRSMENLQENEKKIIRLVGQGCSNKEISYMLNLSDGTVRNYISGILQKLDLRDRTQIAIFAVQSGINSSPVL